MLIFFNVHGNQINQNISWKNWIISFNSLWYWLFLCLFTLADLKPDQKKPVFEEVIKSIVSIYSILCLIYS